MFALTSYIFTDTASPHVGILITSAWRRVDAILLELELGPPPVAPLGVVADGAASLAAGPLGKGTVLLQLASELALDAEGLVSALEMNEQG